eukprot:2455938-Pyramimonas_sp.AAC.1
MGAQEGFQHMRSRFSEFFGGPFIDAHMYRVLIVLPSWPLARECRSRANALARACRNLCKHLRRCGDSRIECPAHILKHMAL